LNKISLLFIHLKISKKYREIVFSCFIQDDFESRSHPI